MPNLDGTPTTVELTAQLTALNAAIASGTTRVSYGDKSVEYRTLAEMYQIRAGLLSQLGLATPMGRSVARYSGGFS